MRLVSCADIFRVLDVCLGTVRLLGSREQFRSCRPACVGTLQLLWSSDCWGVLGSSCQDLNQRTSVKLLGVCGEVFSC